MRRILALTLVAAAAATFAPPAHAGTYAVRACSSASGVAPNRSWAFTVPSPSWATESTCPAGRPQLVLMMAANTSTPALQTATMSFRPPRGAAIRDFELNRQIYYYNPVIDGSGTAPPYILYSWGGLQFAGAGEYDPATRDAINATGHWYGYPSGAIDTTAQVVTKATFPRLAGAPDANSLTIDVGCWTTACSVRSDGTVYTTLYSARIVVADNTRPTVGDVDGAGLFGPGSHGGDEAVSFRAADNVGIRRAELLDVTAGAGSVVGRTEFGCDFARPRPCSDVGLGSVTPSQRLPSGTRTLAVRVTDAAGNQTTTAPRGSLVAGTLNGINASATGRLRAVFTRGGKKRRTVKAGGQPAVSLRLRNTANQPIGGARIQVRVRALRVGAHFKSAAEIRTGPDGRAKLLLARGSSRELRFEYRARVDDPAPVMRAGVRLGVRPKATLSVRPKRVGYGGSIRLKGRVRSRPRPRPGKLVVLQAFDRGRWRTFAATRSKKGGRFSRRYRFSRTFRPRTYRFRARLPREGAYPYSTGNTKTVRVRVG